MFGRSSRLSGFSLVELMVTLAILLLLVSLFTSRGSKTFQRRQKAACREQLQTLYVGMQLYANEHQGVFPLVTNAISPELPLSLLIPQYISTTEPFVCPGTKRSRIPEGAALSRFGVSYAYYMGRTVEASREPLLTDAQLDASEKGTNGAVFSTDGKAPGNNHHEFGGNVMLGDGTAMEIGLRTSVPWVHGPGVKLLNPK